MPALARALATLLGSPWWLLPSLKALASCHVALGPPLPSLASSEALRQRGLAADSSLGPVCTAHFCQSHLPVIPRHHWLWINSLWQMHGSSLAFLLHLRSGPCFTARADPTLDLVLDTYLGLEVPAGHSPAHTSLLSCLTDIKGRRPSRGCSELEDADGEPVAVRTLSSWSGSNTALTGCSPGGRCWHASLGSPGMELLLCSHISHLEWWARGSVSSAFPMLLVPL